MYYQAYCQAILRNWIEDYCKRHNYIIFEIDYDYKFVAYYLDGQDPFEDYDTFDYLEVDLFN
jgi:hypothetical protein